MPILENSGHCGFVLPVPKLAAASEQEVLPSAALGLIEKPTGSLTGRRPDLRRRREGRAEQLRDREVDVDPGGGVGLGGGRLRAEARVEAELVAAGAGRPRRSWRC